MNKVVKRSVAIVLALMMVLLSVSAFAIYMPNGGCRPPMPPHRPHCRKPAVPDTYSLIIRKLVTDDADVGKVFNFTYTVNGGAPVKVVLAATKTAKDSSTYIMSVPKGAKVVVTEVGADAYTTTVNGVAGTSTELTIKVGNNVAEFINSPYIEPEPLAPTGDI